MKGKIEDVELNRCVNPSLLECLRDCPFLVYSTFLLSCGGILIGFDLASLNGILIIPSFITAMGANGYTDVHWAAVSSWMSSSLLLGAGISSSFAAPLADCIGRKNGINISLLIIFSGGCIQTGAITQDMIVIGRLVVGVAIGLLSSIIPLYLAELSPKSIRGFIVSMFQVMIAIGILLAFVVTLIFNTSGHGGSKSYTQSYWRYILGLQAVMPIGMIILGIAIPESPRWLIKIGERDRAKAVLNKIRRSFPIGKRSSEDGEWVIVTNIDCEYEMMYKENEIINNTAPIKWYDFSPLFRRSHLLRTSNSIMINIFTQMTGFSSIISYSSIIFRNMGITADKTTAIIGVLNVFTTFSSLFLIDRLGRRILLASGSVIMFACLLCLSAIALSTDPASHPMSAQAVGVLVALFVVSYAFSYGPIAWLYPAEISPIQVRTKGVAFSTCIGWLTAFAINQSVPLMIIPGSAIGGLGGTFLFFSACTLLATFWVLSHVHETSHLALEDIDRVFEVVGLSDYWRFISTNISYSFYFGKKTMIEFSEKKLPKDDIPLPTISEIEFEFSISYPQE
jgi:MFS transporter, SP family, sugar:H+ symporter